jgi:DNA-binding response OmpR family regulator
VGGDCPRPEQPIAGGIRGKGCMTRILIWGDEHDSCLLTKRVLEKQNHTAAVFTALHDAVQWAKTHQPDLAILDSREEIAAVSVLKTLKSLNPRMNVFMTTTDSPASDHVRTIRMLGAEVFFSRPIAIDELEKRVVTLCSQTKRR